MAHDNVISDQQLLRKLQRAAQVRSIFSMLAILPSLVIGGLIVGDSGNEGLLILIVFGIPMLVSVGITELYCKRIVSCPYCGGTMWNCGTGNFKPRRMKLRKDRDECPKCHAAIQ